MNRFFKGLLMMLLIAVLSLSLFACNDKNSSEDAENDVNFEYEVKEDDDGNKYSVLTSYYISQNALDIIAKNSTGYYFSDLYTGSNKDTDEYKAEKAIYEKVKTVTVPDVDGDGNKVTEIAADAFTGRSEVKKLIIGANVETLADGALSGLSALEELTVPFIGGKMGGVNAERLFGYVFGTVEFTGSTAITQNYNVSGTSAVYVPTTLTKVTVTGADKVENVLTDEDSAAGGITNEVVTPVVSKYAFHNVTTIKEIVFESTDGIKAIEDYTFFGCTGIVSINLPASVKSIGAYAFSGCTSLTMLNYNAETKALFDGLNSLVYICDYAFNGCSALGSVKDSSAVMPASLKCVYTHAFDAVGLTKIDFSATTDCSLNTLAFYKDASLETVVLGVNQKMAYATFQSCEKLAIAGVADGVLVDCKSDD